MERKTFGDIIVYEFGLDKRVIDNVTIKSLDVYWFATVGKIDCNDDMCIKEIRFAPDKSFPVVGKAFCCYCEGDFVKEWGYV